ncbi:permease prefix domain 1-containing protein [Nocardiopsis mangrovi]|uniref:Permease prefix domain 1-containing protein n=1 Tax=Nocardiopsis mangrovi TaxID=1179818 RepID=A0ABV9DVT5_9ACTN
MKAAGGPADPIGDHIAALSAALHGPPRAKARMIAEMRDGLADAAAAHAGAGMAGERAAREAVRGFGTVEEVAPGCQRELTIAQARRTAAAVALAVPLVMACWYLIVSAGHDPAWPPPPTALLPAGVTIAAAVVSAAAMAATGGLARRLALPDRLPLAMAWTATTASVAMVVATITMAVATPLTADWPLVALAGLLTATAHGTVAASARACRHCARLAGAPPAAASADG